MTLRVLRVLNESDIIACEDTRRTSILLKRYSIETPTISFHEHNEEERISRLIALVEKGQQVALVSDAGMPAISDPGYKLIRECLDQGIKVEVLPGPDAIMTALVSSGLPTDSFTFRGFAPPKSASRRSWLEEWAYQKETSVIYESPVRLAGLLEDMAAVFGPERKISVCRELTKKFEEISRGTVSALAASYAAKKVKGEIVVVVEGSREEKELLSPEDIAAMIDGMRSAGKGSKEIASRLSDLTGMSRRQAYGMATGR